ncbi:hypothetical protein G9A89_008375 [Geosiphon pyriformis]|nr:hypothetical protein G9A89_008375 [Geosiphon pyriformis]
MAIKRKLRNSTTPADPQVDLPPTAPESIQQLREPTPPETQQEKQASVMTTKAERIRGRPRKPSSSTAADFVEEDAATSSASATTEAPPSPAKIPKTSAGSKSKSFKGKTKARLGTDTYENAPLQWIDPTVKFTKEQKSYSGGSSGSSTVSGAGQFLEFRINKIVQPPAAPQPQLSLPPIETYPIDVHQPQRNAIIIPSDISVNFESTPEESRGNKPRKWNRKKVVIRTTGGEIAMPVWYSTEPRQLLRNPTLTG